MNRHLFPITLMLILQVFMNQHAFSCSMYKVTYQGKTQVGSNEDAWRNKSKIWFEQATTNTPYGACFTGSRQVGPGRFAPQSGMNEAGLSFVRLAAPSKTSTPVGNKKQIVDPVNYLKDILHTCSTVTEVQRYIEAYESNYFNSDVFIYTDASGAYLIVEPDQLIRGSEPQYVLANFYPSSTSLERARMQTKFRNGMDFLNQHAPDGTPQFYSALSDTMHVCRNWVNDGTLLTSIWDLNNMTVRLFFYHDYQHEVQFDLHQELKKGNHMLDIPSLFPDNPNFEKLTQYITPFNTPGIRISLVFLGGFFLLSSLLFLVQCCSVKRRDKFLTGSILSVIVGFLLTAFMYVLATEQGIFYFPVPYAKPGYPWMTILSYTPFVLLLAFLPLFKHNLNIIKATSKATITKGISTLNTLLYTLLIGAFAYWGFFNVL